MKKIKELKYHVVIAAVLAAVLLLLWAGYVSY